jgi:hypothetical protein
MELQMILGFKLCGRAFVMVPKAERRAVHILSA